MSLIIIASVKTKEAFIESVKTKMQYLVKSSQIEEGCIKYSFHQDNKNPSLFVFVEEWKSRALWKQHLRSEHVRAFVKETESSIIEFKVQEMRLIY